MVYRVLIFSFIATGLVLATACASAPAPTPSGPSTSLSDAAIDAELSAVRTLFERNIKAIQDRDREAYLACYAQTDRLVRVGGDSVKLGYEGLATGTPATGADDWPETLKASNLQVFWIRPGLVYGTYEYQVTIAGETAVGISERVFVRGEDGWRIAVSTAFKIK